MRVVPWQQKFFDRFRSICPLQLRARWLFEPIQRCLNNIPVLAHVVLFLGKSDLLNNIPSSSCVFFPRALFQPVAGISVYCVVRSRAAPRSVDERRDRVRVRMGFSVCDRVLADPVINISAAFRLSFTFARWPTPVRTARVRVPRRTVILGGRVSTVT